MNDHQRRDCVVLSIDVGTRKAGVVITKQDDGRGAFRILFMSLIDFFPKVMPTFEALERRYRCMEFFDLKDEDYQRDYDAHLAKFESIETELDRVKRIFNQEKRSASMTDALIHHQSLGKLRKQRLNRYMNQFWFDDYHPDEGEHKSIPVNGNALMIQFTKVLRIYADYWTACFGQIHVAAIETQPEMTELNTHIQYYLSGFFAGYQPSRSFEPIIPIFVDASNKLKIYHFDMRQKIRLMNAKKYNHKHWSMLVHNVDLDRSDLVCERKTIPKAKAKLILPEVWDTDWADRAALAPPRPKRNKIDIDDDDIDHQTVYSIDDDQDEHDQDEHDRDEDDQNQLDQRHTIQQHEQVKVESKKNIKKRPRVFQGRFRYPTGDEGKRNHHMRIANKHEAVRRWTIILKDTNLVTNRRWMDRWLNVYTEIDKRDCADAGLQALYTMDLYWQCFATLHGQPQNKSNCSNPILEYLYPALVEKPQKINSKKKP